MTDKLLEIIGKQHRLSEKDTCGFSDLKAKGMKFHIRAFDAEGLGHVSVMTAKGMLGLMKMDTVIINPKEKDLPLYSYDRIKAFGSDVLITELYDTLAQPRSFGKVRSVVKKYNDLPLRNPGAHWYDGIKLPESVSFKGKKISDRFDSLASEYLSALLAEESPAEFDRELKEKKASEYAKGLLDKGGPSTDVFVKEFGKEKTSVLFSKVLFGTEK
ncbi:MAG: hypothetical protein IJU57_07360 [Clostridia bacterium]|nr:hypothetical protein [Clostridia bacterium]